jgi:flagellar biosynthesis/type III secretory pathway protein FliH
VLEHLFATVPHVAVRRKLLSTLRLALQRLVPEQTQRIMGWLTQPYFDKGKAEGRAEGRNEGRNEGRAEGRNEGRNEGRAEGRNEGRNEGRAEGEARVLVRLIEKRFGVLSPQLRERILAADVASVEEWVERLFDAPDLQSVFGSN